MPCSCCGGFTHIDAPGFDVDKTLAGRFVKVADCLRNMNTTFGLRRCIVRLIFTQWTGGSRGVGEEYVTSATEILPNPRVLDFTGIAEVVSSAALIEAGSLVVQEISGRYQEDALRGLGPGGTPIPKDTSFYWEVEFVNRGGNPLSNVKRRFTPSSVPAYLPGKVQWVQTLQRAQGDRKRDGQPR